MGINQHDTGESPTAIEVLSDLDADKVSAESLDSDGDSTPSSTDHWESTLLLDEPNYPVKALERQVWEINGWIELPTKTRGPKFTAGDFEWNVLIFPRGNNGNPGPLIYLEPTPLDKSVKEWYVCAAFAFDLWNPEDPKVHVSGSSHHRFSNNELDWGFGSLISGTSAYKLRDLVHKNQLNITTYVKIFDDSETGVLWYNFLDYDSKKNTGYVGLNNQGATCYLNSLLQSYFTTKLFRKLVYQIPTESVSVSNGNKKIKKTGNNNLVALSLQKVFYLLSTSDKPIGTLELTKSFGWDTSDAFTQHDIQELNRILMDKLEISMKGTPIENKLNDIFVGKMKSFIKCINVPYESSREEDFWDIQLNVKGFSHLSQAFDNYIELEMLTDDNKYQAGDEYGYQDAKKGVVFTSFPPVLHLQLKRFEYDFMIDELQKINDFYEYPDSIDLAPYLDEDLPAEVKAENWTYKLHGVLVHQGSISNGHYYAMIKPSKKDEWLRFEDDKVWKVTKYQTFEENFGANDMTQDQFSKLTKYEQNDFINRRQTSAYMLVYYRESAIDEILIDEEEVNKEVPKFIPIEIERQLNETKMLEQLKLQQLYNLDVKLIDLSIFQNYSEFDYYLDPSNLRYYDEQLVTDANRPITFNLKKTDSIFKLYQEINALKSIELNVESKEDIQKLPYRLWLICHRNNHTNRVDSILSLEGLHELSLQNVYVKLFNRKFDEMVFFIEEFSNDLAAAGKADAEHGEITSGDIIVFFKHFDGTELKGLTHLVVSKDSVIETVIPQLQRLLGTDEPISLIEELTPNKLEPVLTKSTFEKSEFGNGDILICHTVPQSELFAHYKFLSSRIHIKVGPSKLEYLDEEEEEEEEDEMEDEQDLLDLWVSHTATYKELSEIIGKKVGIDADYLRIFIKNQHGMRFPMNTTSNLLQYLPKNLPILTIIRFEYEKLDISLREFESMKSLKVYWIDKKVMNYHEHTIFISIHDNVYDLVEKVLEKVEGEVTRNNLLVYSGNDCKYVDIIGFNKAIQSLNESFDYYIGEFPNELRVLADHDMITTYKNLEIVIDPQDAVLNKELELVKKYNKTLNVLSVYHFHKSSINHHSVPFLFISFPDEKFSDTKERLQYKLGLNDLNFSKVKFALANSSDKGKYLDESDELCLYDEGNTGDYTFLALDHPDRHPKKSFDKGISIR